MEKSLDLRVLLELADRFSEPSKRVSLTSTATAKAVRAAREQTKKLQDQMREVKDLQKMQRALGTTGQELDAAKRSLASLNREQQQSGDTTKRMTARIEKARQAVDRLSDRQQALKRHAAQTRMQLREQGVDTRHLSQREQDLSDKIDQVNRRLATQKTWLSRVGKAGQIAGGMLERTWGVIKGATVAAGAAGAAMFPFVKTAAQFEQYQAILETVDGSQAKAAKSMQWISNFAVSTPYELDQVTEAYVRLRAYGMEPTNGLLRTLGDTSAAMGKDVMSAVEAIADAITGENERLKEFGIKASTKGNTITYTYTDKNGIQKQMQVMKNDRKAIEQGLRQIWDEKYAGAMERQSKTIGGLWSNLMDQWTRFQQMVMASGPFEKIKGRLSDLLDRINEMAANGQLQALADRVGAQMVRLIDGLTIVAVKLWHFGQVALDVGTRIAGMVGGWENFAMILIAAKILPTSLLLGQLGRAAWWLGKMALPIVTQAVLFLGRALLMNPIGLVITAIVGGAILIVTHWTQVKAALGAVWDWIKTTAVQVAEGARNAFLNFTPVGQIIQHWDTIRAGIGTTVDWVSSLPGRMADYGRRIIEGLGLGIDEKLAWIKAKIHGLADMLPEWLRKKLDIHSPSRVFARIGDDTMAGLALGLDRSGSEPVGRVLQMGDRLKRTAAGITLVAAGTAAGSMPAAAAQGMAGAQIHIHQTIHAAPGQDPEAIGRGATRQAFELARGSRAGALYDQD